jgi:hypothetical protein
MPNPAIAVAGVSAGASVAGAKAQRKATDRATDAQVAASRAGIAENRRQFEKVQELLAPYVDAGTGALSDQLALTGISGPAAQQAAIDAIENGPQFNSLVEQGENAILQNASATGGLRGGNTQSSLAQFRPSILNRLIESQYSKLAGLSSQGQNAAAGVGNAALQTGNNVSNLFQQQGAAQAGGALAQGRIQANLFGNLANIGGQIAGGFGGGNIGSPAANSAFRAGQGGLF